ncbi:MAG TPA: plasmid pRiA4b ORF-3 family protein [Candidatus Binatia bacterium]|nr:plasmid pRiA4b ORF-3 family protein [Candidatus Binatia bacterium]
MLDPPPAVIYQLKIALRGISPLIWRRLLVSADTSIADLHHILQLALGWTSSHLHRFLIRGKEYGIAYDGGMGFDDDPKQIRLANFRLRLRERFLYEYDFNVPWQHDMRVEQIVAADANRTSPMCIGGKRAAPPEDCGGVEAYLAQWRHWQYEFLCRRLQGRVKDIEQDSFTDDEDEDRSELGYDPDHFDRRAVSTQLRQWGVRGGQS